MRAVVGSSGRKSTLVWVASGDVGGEEAHDGGELNTPPLLLLLTEFRGGLTEEPTAES